jgi:hypothetical protein
MTATNSPAGQKRTWSCVAAAIDLLELNVCPWVQFSLDTRLFSLLNVHGR